MARKPSNFEWLGYTGPQIQLLNSLDVLGNNGWANDLRNQEAMPRMMRLLHASGLPVQRVKEAMQTIGYSRQALGQLDWWETQRTSGNDE